MSIELVGLAYDRARTDALWSEVTLRDACDIILQDEFRRKVDPRSLLYHKGQLGLLQGFEQCIKQGGKELSLVGLIARRFAAGVEEFPCSVPELAFDFQLIRYFSPLAMVDDFLVADPFLRELLRKSGFLTDGAGWSLLEMRDFDRVENALKDVRMNDILDVGRRLEGDRPATAFENLVRNYIEFLGFARNNRLVPFFYNSQADFRRWGDLAERKNRRNETIVDLSFKGKIRSPKPSVPVRKRKKEESDVTQRSRQRREAFALLEGLKDSDPLVRQKAAESLGRLVNRELAPELIRALSAQEAEVRQEIVRALGALDGIPVTEALIEVMQKDDVASVRLCAAHALTRRGDATAIPYMLDAVERGEPHFALLLSFHPRFGREKAIQKRVTLMALSDNIAVRREAAFLSGELGKQGVTVLKELVGDSDEWVKIHALYALQRLDRRAAGTQADAFLRSGSEASHRAGTIVKFWSEPQRA